MRVDRFSPSLGDPRTNISRDTVLLSRAIQSNADHYCGIPHRGSVWMRSGPFYNRALTTIAESHIAAACGLFKSFLQSNGLFLSGALRARSERVCRKDLNDPHAAALWESRALGSMPNRIAEGRGVVAEKRLSQRAGATLQPLLLSESLW